MPSRPFPTRLASLVLLVAAFAVALCQQSAPAAAAEPSAPAAAAGPPRLAVLVVFDQMRGDYLQKWRPLFGPDGFARLQSEGAWFTECHYPYAGTSTGPGHASILSGCSPREHGIIGNSWYDRAAGGDVSCAIAPRYERVPPAANRPNPEKGHGSPERMLAPTVADSLKWAHPAAKVIGLSIKERSAILPTGHRADGAYWFDTADGIFVTSTYYRDALPGWVDAFNRRRPADRWFGKDWERSRPDVDYERHAGPDDIDAEGKGYGQGRTFPHPTDGREKRPGRKYYSALVNSPFGNDLLFELAKEAVVAEQLGQDAVPDLLVVSFSSNDVVGHCWGPDSQEVLDMTLRSDRMMAELLRFLDEKVGAGKYVLAVTADHGICPLPEVAAARGKDAKRFDPGPLLAAAENHLKKTFGEGRWIERTSAPWIYLNRKLIAEKGLKPDDVARALAEWVAKQPPMFRAYTRAELNGEMPEDDAIGRRVKRSFHPERAGDVFLVPKPYHLASGGLTGTTHGTPHPYDTHVPLLAFGPGIRGGAKTDAVTPQAAAAIFAKALGVPPPERCTAEVPPGVFGE